MIYRKIVFPFLILLIIGACSRRKYKYKIVDNINRDSLFEQINLRNSSGENVNLSNLFKRIGYVKLETTDDCLIGTVSKLLFFDNKLFVLDTEKANSLFVFSRDGKFLFKLSKGIGGPGEFTELTDVSINELDSSIYVLSRNQSLLFKYNLKGKFIISIHVPPYIDNFQSLNDGSFLLYREFRSIRADPLSNSRLMVLSPNGRIKVGWFTQPINPNLSMAITDPIVRSVGTTYSIARPYENIIYSFLPDSLTTKIKYYVDFGNDDPAELASLKSFPELDRFQKKHSFLIGNAIDTKCYTYFMFYDKEQVKFYFKDKRNGEKIVVRRFVNNIDYIPCYPFQYGDDSCLVAVLPSNTLKELYNAAIKEYSQKRERIDTIYKYGALTQETDNPLIASYYLK